MYVFLLTVVGGLVKWTGRPIEGDRGGYCGCIPGNSMLKWGPGGVEGEGE